MHGNIHLSRAALGYESVDLHRHATFRCGWLKMMRRIGRLFG